MATTQKTTVVSPITITAPAAVTAGVPFLLGTRNLCIPMTTQSSGELVAVEIDKIWEVPAASAATGSIFTDAYWDDTAKNVTNTSSGNTRCGIFMAAKTNGQTTALVMLNA